jgi:hypothetical protein
MSTVPTQPRTVAAVFDLRQEPSFQALFNMVGEEAVLKYVQRGKPFLVIVVEPKVGETSRLAFENDSELLDFYLSTLRLNVTLEPKKRIQFVLRDLTPEVEAMLREATAELAQELDGAAAAIGK